MRVAIAAALVCLTAHAVEIPDAALLNQHGKPVRLRTDLLGKGVVIVNFVFTSCLTVCPPMGATFGRLEKLLAERGETGIRLISISVDPLNDTPEKLAAWAAQFRGGPNWTLLTGPKAEITAVLRAFGAFTPDKLSHSSLAMIGNPANGDWIRASSLGPPEKLADLAKSLERQK